MGAHWEDLIFQFAWFVDCSFRTWRLEQLRQLLYINMAMARRLEPTQKARSPDWRHLQQ